MQMGEKMILLRNVRWDGETGKYIRQWAREKKESE